MKVTLNGLAKRITTLDLEIIVRVKLSQGMKKFIAFALVLICAFLM